MQGWYWINSRSTIQTTPNRRTEILTDRTHVSGGSAPTVENPAMAAGASDETESKALLSLILDSLDQDKAEEVLSIDLRGKSSVADHMVVASGRSSRQVTAIESPNR